MLTRIKRIRSHIGLRNWLLNVTDANEWLARGQVEEIPSPYAYSPSKPIYVYDGRKVVWFETSHKIYDVFEVPANLLRFKSCEAAEDWHVRFCVRH